MNASISAIAEICPHCGVRQLPADVGQPLHASDKRIVPAALLWGLLAFLCSYIPNVGYFLALVPPLLFGFLVGGWSTGIAVLVVYGVINGVGSVLVFIPQIALLFLFIACKSETTDGLPATETTGTSQSPSTATSDATTTAATGSGSSNVNAMFTSRLF